MAGTPRTTKVDVEVSEKDRLFWLTLRRALLNIARAIEVRYGRDET